MKKIAIEVRGVSFQTLQSKIEASYIDYSGITVSNEVEGQTELRFSTAPQRQPRLGGGMTLRNDQGSRANDCTITRHINR